MEPNEVSKIAANLLKDYQIDVSKLNGSELDNIVNLILTYRHSRRLERFGIGVRS